MITKKLKDFSSKYNVDEYTGCWIWQRCVGNHGYGVLTINNTHYLAHRYSYYLKTGKNTKLCLLHKCDNRKCINPEHLFEGTRTDNQLDMKLKGRSIKIISDTVVQDIRTDFLQGNVTYTQLGLKYNVSRQHVKRLVMHKYR